MGDKYPHNVNKKQVVEQQRYLFDDLIIEEILTRLPVKSVLRFKSVSKQWYSTLSSSDFANAHLMRSPFSHHSAPVNSLLVHCYADNYLFSFDDSDDLISGTFEDNLVKLDAEFGGGFGGYYLILAGCCNGLICLTSYFNEFFVLWNPTIRKLHKYESDGYFERVDPNYPNCHPKQISYGFGHVSCVDDYKFLRILTVVEGYEESGTNTVHIFSRSENKWREINFDFDYLVILGRGELIDEKLYWVARSNGTRVLVSFDLGVERFDIIKVNLDSFDNLGVMGGALSKCNCDDEYEGDKFMHILESPTIVKKSIGLPKGLLLNPTSEMVGFTRNDKFFVTGPLLFEGIQYPNRTLGIVDTCTRPMQYTTLSTFNMWIEIARYVPSLVSPFPIESLQRHRYNNCFLASWLV